jgi:hypothetical protein
MTEQRWPARDEDLEAALARLREELDLPPAPDLSGAVRQRLLEGQRPARSRWAALVTPRGRLAATLLACALLAALVIALWPAARMAIAERFGLPGIEIRFIASPTPAPATSTAQRQETPPAPAATATVPAPTPTATPVPSLSLGTEVSLGEAQRRVPFRILLPAALGQPDAVYLDETRPVPVVTLVYRPCPPEIPATQVAGVGLLIMQFQGSPDEPVFAKGVGPESVIEPVTVRNGPGYWIAGGPHILIVRTPGGEWQDEPRLAGNTLLWVHRDLTLRLEGDISKETALLIAESME